MYNSFYLNPYLYNPAEAATDYAYVFANYRKQWLNLEGAPTVATLNYNTLIDNSRAGIGLKLSSYSRGLLNTSEAVVTYAHGVVLNPENILYFGISGGGSSSMIDINKASDPNDPALANYPSGFRPSANFGIRLASQSGITLGAALPQLFGSVYSLEQPSKTGLVPFDNMIFTFSFKRKLESRIVTRSSRGVSTRKKSAGGNAPLELYALYRYAAAGNNQFEAVAKFNLSSNFWLGAGYRQQYGLIGSVGVQVDRFIFAYSYEPGTQPVNGFSAGSHEVQLGLRIGGEKKFKIKAPVFRSTLGTEVVRHNPRYHEKTVDDEEALRDEDKKRYYVYVKTFTEFDKAEDFKKKLIAQKYNGQIYFYPKNKQYYVYTFETTKISEANEEMKNLKSYTKLKEAKVLTVIDK
ncbi:hypothetical protein WSM22_25040 [Cytophagales bacterium WSM2-2]|nr:hypothetical protein WSM22_25040 [Cytophagales bacterium WSM2-2]